MASYLTLPIISAYNFVLLYIWTLELKAPVKHSKVLYAFAN